MNSSRFLAGGLAAMALAFIASPAFAQLSISIDIAPPPLVVEQQPPIPDDGYVWTPGYWAYDNYQEAYYWVLGSWEQPPEVGLLWTPAYWGWEGNAYVYHDGYWGQTVGFYGGVNYGHGYWGRGYGGGRWNNGHFAYNRAANNITNVHVQNVYVDNTVVRPQSKRISYNGGAGGTKAQPTPQEQAVAQRVPATPQQQSHVQMATQQRSHEVKVKPAVAGAQAAPAPGAQPAAAVQPAAQPQQPQAAQAKPQGEQQFTGENAEDKKKEHAADSAQVPAQHPAPAPNPVNQPEAKPNPVAQEQHTPAAQPPVDQAKLEEKAHQAGSSQNPAAEVKPVIKEGAAPEVHPQAQAQPHIQAAPHPEVKAPVADKPQAKAADQASGPDDKH